MSRLLLTAIISACLGLFPVLAGETHVSGAVSGTWAAGEDIFADGPIYVPPQDALIIEHGVRIRFKTDHSFVIHGGLEILGTDLLPVVLSTPDGWQGFEFQPLPNVFRHLENIVISPESGEPDRVVTAVNSWLLVKNCNLRAKHYCLDIDGGILRAHSNKFLTTHVLSKTVRLCNLVSGSDNPHPCDDSLASAVSGNNMISAIVASNEPVEPSQEFTAGLEVRDCSRLCINDNAILVEAPGNALGAYFTSDQQHANYQNELRFTVVTVRSAEGQPYGIWTAQYGQLQIIHCDVLAASPRFWPRGIEASHRADVYVNSSNVVLNQAESENDLLHTSGAGTITVDRVIKWANEVASKTDQSGKPGGNERTIDRMDIMNVREEGPVYFTNPLFRLNGEWGQWNSLDDVAEYYGLQADSPCIDSADARFGLDPDFSLPDIGPFYYPQEPNDVPLTPAIPLTAGLSPAYPNPFNSATVLPFVLNQTGTVEIRVYDLLGRQVSTLDLGTRTAGSHTARFQADHLSTGMYIVTLRQNESTLNSRPILLIK